MLNELLDSDARTPEITLQVLHREYQEKAGHRPPNGGDYDRVRQL